MPKDRHYELPLSSDVKIVVERSSAHPVTYAILLVAYRDGHWHTVRTFDNAHATHEHHEHGYAGAHKQPPTVTHREVNEAMSIAIIKLRDSWTDILDVWETTR